MMILALPVASPAATLILDVPPEVAGHGFAFEGTVGGTSGPLSFQEVNLLTGPLRLRLEITVDTGSSVTGHNSLTGGSFSIENWSDGVALNGVAGDLMGASTELIRTFAVPNSRAGHEFVLWLPSQGLTFPVSKTAPLVANTPANSALELGFFNAYSFTGLSWAQSWGASELVDITSWQIPVIGGLNNLTSAGWVATSLALPTRSVQAWVTPSPLGNGTYEFHTSAGTVQSSSPQFGTSQAGEGFYITGTAGIGTEWWLVREGDRLMSPRTRMQFTNQESFLEGWSSDWSWLSLESATFGQNLRATRDERIYLGYPFWGGGIGAEFTEPGYETQIVYFQEEVYDNTTIWTTWDAFGNTINYPVKAYIARVPVGASVTRYGVFSVPNHPVWYATPSSFTPGWEPWTGTAPLGTLRFHIPEFRRGHEIVVRQPDEVEVPMGFQQGYSAPGASLTMWVTYYAGTDSERTGAFEYIPCFAYHTFVADNNGTAPFTYQLVDKTTNEVSDLLWSDGVESAPALWYPAASSIALKLPQQRWLHSLSVINFKGEYFPVVKGQSQGVWSEAGNTGQFTSYGWFDATSYVRPGVGWWVVDDTTFEVAAVGVDDLMAWQPVNGDTDTDGDGLADWYENLLGTDPNDADTDGDGVNDGLEARLGRNPLKGLATGGSVSLDVYIP